VFEFLIGFFYMRFFTYAFLFFNLIFFSEDKFDHEYNGENIFSHIVYNNEIFSDEESKLVDVGEKIIKYYLKKRDDKRAITFLSENENTKKIRESLFFNFNIKSEDLFLLRIKDNYVEYENFNFKENDLISNITTFFEVSSLRDMSLLKLNFDNGIYVYNSFDYSIKEPQELYVLFFNVNKYYSFLSKSDISYVENFEYKDCIPIAAIVKKIDCPDCNYISFLSSEAKNQFFGAMILTLTINDFLNYNNNYVKLTSSINAVNFYKKYGFKEVIDCTNIMIMDSKFFKEKLNKILSK
jgi:hypothetical protein